MTVLIDNRTGTEIEASYWEAIRRTALESLRFEGFAENCEISVSIVSNAEIQSINKAFRNIDSVTDVLSFPQLTFEEGEIAGVNENDEIILGDIIISLDKAVSQAQEYGHSLKREIAFLTAHSMLHLLGYDHMTPEEETEMIQKQRGILNGVGISREQV